jgi:hypothetical protein
MVHAAAQRGAGVAAGRDFPVPHPAALFAGVLGFFPGGHVDQRGWAGAELHSHWSAGTFSAAALRPGPFRFDRPHTMYPVYLGFFRIASTVRRSTAARRGRGLPPRLAGGRWR